MPDTSAVKCSADPFRALQARIVAARRTQALDASPRDFASKGFNRAIWLTLGGEPVAAVTLTMPKGVLLALGH